MPNFTPESFQAALTALGRDLSDSEKRKITRDMAQKAEKIATSVASGDLGGDPKFSGWKPTLDLRVKSAGTGALLIPTRRSAGPWTVAEKGRHADGGVGRFQGPSVNIRTGQTSRRADGSVRAGRSRRGIRWNGVTSGKRTASRAVEQIERATLDVAEKGVRTVIRKRFDVN